MTFPVAETDVEAELSYAFLHAVSSRAGAECTVKNRLSDNRGIDAQLTSWGPFTGEKREVDLKVQLKATIAQPADFGTHYSYSIKKIAQYDDLRANAYAVPRILVVLFLPKEELEWIDVSHDLLTVKRSAYWVSLAGAPEVNTASVTVHIPKNNLLTPASLRKLFDDLSHGSIPSYIPMGKS